MTLLQALKQTRTEHIYFAQMSLLTKQKKHAKKVIRLEDFTDDTYSQSFSLFNQQHLIQEPKLLIQTQPHFSRLVEDFLQFKYFLGECFCVTLPTNQTFVVFDQEWFFRIVRKIVGNSMEAAKLEYDHLVNVWSLRMESLEASEFMDEMHIANYQQVEFIYQILIDMDFVMKSTRNG
jgi:hypothetical protein